MDSEQASLALRALLSAAKAVVSSTGGLYATSDLIDNLKAAISQADRKPCGDYPASLCSVTAWYDRDNNLVLTSSSDEVVIASDDLVDLRDILTKGIE